MRGFMGSWTLALGGCGGWEWVFYNEAVVVNGLLVIVVPLELKRQSLFDSVKGEVRLQEAVEKTELSSYFLFFEM